MSAIDTKQPRKQKQREPKSHPTPNGAERLKIVVRRLPPNLPEDIFWQSVHPWVTDDAVAWKTFCPGKLRTKRLNKEGIPSRAYIVFKSEEQVATFSREYDGHVFKDKAGNESLAIVEFAPFQKVPAEKKKVDARNNTIDKDDDYISFCDTLKNTTKTESVSLETLIAASQAPPPPTTTPLLEALKAEKSAQKDKEAILRNHTHYKDIIPSGTPSKKEEAKKKAVAAHVAKLPLEPPAPLSKKAKKAAAAAAAQKASSTQVQDGQGPSGKSQPPPAAAPSTVKPATPVTIVAHPSRHRPPKDSHARSHPGKGDASAPAPASASGPGSAPAPAPPKSDATLSLPVAPENTSPSSPVPVPVASPRGKSRPVIGLGRHFEAALNGAGVAVAPGSGSERKKRDRGGGGGGEPGSGTAENASGRGSKHREDARPKGSGAAGVPSILQRPSDAGGAGGVSEPVAMAQRPQSPRGTEGGGAPGGHGEGVVRGGGGPRRGRGRGRGGHRGG